MASVRALARRFAIAERADVACCGMTVAQAATLEALFESDGVRLGELTQRLGITSSTLTRNLARLRDRDLVTTSRDVSDGRASRVFLTSRGRRAADAVHQQEEAFFKLVLAQLPDDRAHHILETIEELWTAVRRATQSCCPGAFDHLMADPPTENRSTENYDCQTC